MREKVMQDMRKSMAFVDVARPIIRGLLNGGETLAVEGDDNEVCRMLDMTCGTDYFHVLGEKGLVWGVASRVQYYNPDADRNGRGPYNSFTVRKERESGNDTEYAKRKFAIEHHGVYPYLTMHAYINTKSGEVESLALVRTEDLMDFVDKGLASERHTGAAQTGQAAFFVAYWDEMIKAGYKVLKYTA